MRIIHAKMSFDAIVDDGQTRASDARHPKITIAHHGPRGLISSRGVRTSISKETCSNFGFSRAGPYPLSPLWISRWGCNWGNSWSPLFCVYELPLILNSVIVWYINAPQYKAVNRVCTNSFLAATITIANKLNPDQVWQNVRPDLDPNRLTLK